MSKNFFSAFQLKKSTFISFFLIFQMKICLFQYKKIHKVYKAKNDIIKCKF